jgi:hypothetical protein
MFTATAVMQLVEMGLLDLDAPVSQYLPWLPTSTHNITTRQLLSHSSGLIQNGEDAEFFELEQPFPSVEELQLVITAKPGEQYKYSNGSFGLLGMIVHAVTGIPYNDYVIQNIIRRSELLNTGPDLDDHAREHLATGYYPDRNGRRAPATPHAQANAMSAAAGCYATAKDLCKFAAAHCFGNQLLLRDESKQILQSVHWNVQETREPYAYGLGFQIHQVGKRTYIGHDGSFPGFRTACLFDPNEQLVVVVMANAKWGEAREVTRGILQIIDRTQAIITPAPDHYPQDLRRFSGRFHYHGTYFDFISIGSDLYALEPGADNPNPVRLRSIAEATFTLPLDAPDFLGEIVRFRLPQERVPALQVLHGGKTLLRVPIPDRKDPTRQLKSLLGEQIADLLTRLRREDAILAEAPLGGPVAARLHELSEAPIYSVKLIIPDRAFLTFAADSAVRALEKAGYTLNGYRISRTEAQSALSGACNQKIEIYSQEKLQLTVELNERPFFQLGRNCDRTLELPVLNLPDLAVDAMVGIAEARPKAGERGEGIGVIPELDLLLLAELEAKKPDLIVRHARNLWAGHPRELQKKFWRSFIEKASTISDGREEIARLVIWAQWELYALEPLNPKYWFKKPSDPEPPILEVG